LKRKRIKNSFPANYDILSLEWVIYWFKSMASSAINKTSSYFSSPVLHSRRRFSAGWSNNVLAVLKMLWNTFRPSLKLVCTAAGRSICVLYNFIRYSTDARNRLNFFFS
jgi:hypothetical protein